MKAHFSSLVPVNKRPLNYLLVFLLVLGLSHCKKSNDVNPNGTDATIALTDPNELSKVMVIPGATLVQGSPPTATNTSNATQLSTSTPDVSAISGQDATFSLNYSNASGDITVIYIQFEGSDYYFKIPIAGNSGTNGSINIPMRIPENYTITPFQSTTKKSMGRFCCWASTVTAQEIQNSEAFCGNDFSSTLPPKPGKGTVSIGGKNYDATAVCNLDLGGLGKGYGIQINDTQFVILYNLNRGSSQLVDVVNSNYSPSDGVPWAAFFDGSTIYYSTSGSANYNGSVVSVSGHFEDFSGNQTSLSATGNCQ